MGRLLLDKLGTMRIRAHDIKKAIEKEIAEGMKPTRTGKLKAEHQELIKELKGIQEAARLTKLQSKREGTRTAGSLEIQGIQAKREVGIRVESLGKEYTNCTL